LSYALKVDDQTSWVGFRFRLMLKDEPHLARQLDLKKGFPNKERSARTISGEGRRNVCFTGCERGAGGPFPGCPTIFIRDWAKLTSRMSEKLSSTSRACEKKKIYRLK
jgi:hypothetical protein